MFPVFSNLLIKCGAFSQQDQLLFQQQLKQVNII